MSFGSSVAAGSDGDGHLGQTLQRRRLALMAQLPEVSVVVSAGTAPSRNYRANTYEFRASSHFLYLVGLPLAERCWC